MSRYTFFIILLISVIIISFSIYSIIMLSPNPKSLSKTDLVISNVGSANIGGDFKLIDKNGKNFNSKELNGKLALLYFGFTFCPDICPATLQIITEVLNKLEPYSNKLSAVFITIDPERDTVDQLHDYMKHFHPRIIALTGTNEAIKDVSSKYKVYHSKTDNSVLEDYMINHSSFIYLMNDGKYVCHFAPDTSAERIIEEVKKNLD